MAGRYTYESEFCQSKIGQLAMESSLQAKGRGEQSQGRKWQEGGKGNVTENASYERALYQQI